MTRNGAAVSGETRAAGEGGAVGAARRRFVKSDFRGLCRLQAAELVMLAHLTLSDGLMRLILVSLKASPSDLPELRNHPVGCLASLSITSTNVFCRM